jgi:moderate conductance mechanosensitive channel
MEFLTRFLAIDVWWIKLLEIVGLFALAWLTHRLAGPVARRLFAMERITNRRKPLRVERVQTLRGLSASMVSFLAFLTAAILSLRLLDVSADTLVWVLGLFAAAFGFSARPVVSDVLTGIGFLFENPYDVSEKIEIMPGVQGVVEEVNLRTTLLRAYTGELYIVPNGEVRLIRNFSRGRFSIADIKLRLISTDLDEALPVLETLAHEAVTLLPNLLEPWKIISETGVIGSHTELTLTVKARFGKAADLRPRLLSLVQKRLEDVNITLVN